MDITGVPDFVKRKDVLKIIKFMGIDPVDVMSLKIHVRFIDLELRAKDVEGKYVIDYETESYATHHLVISIVEGD